MKFASRIARGVNSSSSSSSRAYYCGLRMFSVLLYCCLPDYCTHTAGTRLPHSGATRCCCCVPGRRFHVSTSVTVVFLLPPTTWCRRCFPFRRCCCCCCCCRRLRLHRCYRRTPWTPPYPTRRPSTRPRNSSEIPSGAHPLRFADNLVLSLVMVILAVLIRHTYHFYCTASTTINIASAATCTAADTTTINGS